MARKIHGESIPAKISTHSCSGSTVLRQLSTFGSEDSRRIGPSKNQHSQLLREHCPAAAEYVWLGRFTENRSQQKSAPTVAQGALSFGSLVRVIGTNKHYRLTGQEAQKLSICFTYITFNAYIVILLHSLLILCADYRHHELRRLLRKATTRPNPHSRELRPMVHPHEEMADRRRPMECC